MNVSTKAVLHMRYPLTIKINLFRCAVGSHAEKVKVAAGLLSVCSINTNLGRAICQKIQNAVNFQIFVLGKYQPL